MQRLSGLDASFLYFETPTQQLHISSLLVLDPSTMPGGYSFETLKDGLRARLGAVPVFRRRLRNVPLNLGHPVWIEDPDFDLDRHVHRIAVPPPGGRAELADLTADLASIPLDRSRPLWEVWIVEGLPDGQIGVVFKMHHAATDGVQGAEFMAALCGLDPEPPPPLPDDWQPDDGVNELALAAKAVLGIPRKPIEMARLLPTTLAVVPRWVRASRQGEGMPAPFTAPGTSFNTAITAHRAVAYANADLADIKEIKNAFGAKVNDVVLTACAGALRTYLESRDELPERSLVASVPVAVREGREERASANRVSSLLVRLHTDIEDPVERLQTIADANREAKELHNAIGGHMLQDWAEHAAPNTFAFATRIYSSMRLADRHPPPINLVVSNVPGPPVPLYFLGARIVHLYPLGPVMHGIGLNITVMSLEGRLNMGLIACREAAPSLWTLADAFPEAVAELLQAARAG